MNSTILKFLLSDNESLAQYANGKYVAFEDIKRRMFLKAREQNRAIPDHYFRLARDNAFNNLGSISDVLSKGLPDLASDYLELVDEKIYVQANEQNSWQEIITYIPPLLLQCAFLFKSRGASLQIDKPVFFYKKYLLPNTKYTAIPSPKIPQLDYYVNEQHGLHDLHMHLNGALETDQVWQDYLASPRKIYANLRQAYKTGKVREQMEQESSLLDPNAFWQLLKAAQKMRSYFYNYLFESQSLSKSLDDNVNIDALLNEFLNLQSDLPSSYKHPFLSLIGADENSYPYLMSIEGLMYVLLLKEIEQNPNEVLAGLFHFYLLILGLTNRLLVQQVHQYGFEQFQKHTLNGLRWESEHIYRRRYFQLHGNDSRHIRYLEGRFAPAKSEAEAVKLIASILDGWDYMQRVLFADFENIKLAFLRPELKLIAHFIKQEDRQEDDFIRHKKLRYDVWERGKILSLLLINHPKYREKIVAVDAAASEFDAPPEVFAPVFRLMRRSGIRHFTYHAGEDFYHIISGLRAIYEAIVFCGLKNGDRIGHATAAGISARLWQNDIGEQMLIKQGEHLDNLIFCYHLIVEFKILPLNSLIPFIANEVQNLSYDIYNAYYPLPVLAKAWLMRQCCPINSLQIDKATAGLKTIYSEEEWNFMLSGGFLENRCDINDNDVWKLFRDYHDLKYRKRFNKIVTINPFDIFKIEDIEMLQLGLLAEMNKREIVIETLPTSNVRIGFHRNFRSYHLWNWIKWMSEGKSIPPIVVGSDDTGIFATNIYNEYANIYCTLLNDQKLPHSKVMDIIKKLDEDSHVYRFD